MFVIFKTLGYFYSINKNSLKTSQMTTTLEFSHSITDLRKKGTIVVKQEMIVKAKYDYSDDSLKDVEVHIYQNGQHVAEISKLLDNAEGNPLALMLGNIDWRQIYRDQKVLELQEQD